MTFKELIAHDNRSIFLNQNEFAELHMVNGKEMSVQIDNNELIDREKHYQYTQNLYSEGIYVKELLIYVSAEEFGKLPAVGRLLNLDGKTYTISDAINEDGIYSLSLKANKTGGGKSNGAFSG